MKYHANAKLTVHQRRALHEEFRQGASLTTLAARYRVTTKTVQKWAHRTEFTDRSSAPHRRRTRRPAGLAEAVAEAAEADPARGSLGLAQRLRRLHPGATRHQVRCVLREQGRLHPRPSRRRRRRPLPVGRHRVQMDVQQLPAITGGSGFEYKITVLHLRTRLKYSEIHPICESETVTAVLLRALEALPPVRLVWTDNAFVFTMRYSAHPERRTAFQQRVLALDLLHGTCRPRSPWQNGFVERSHRTDNEELFHVQHFADSEERRYQLRLFEMYYAHERPHQGLGGQTPFEVYQQEYPLHAASRMLGIPSYALSNCQGPT